MTKSKTIPEYISRAPEDSQRKLREMRAILKKAAPKAEEGIKWSMPAFSQKRILVMFGAFKKHIGFFPTGAAMKSFEKDLKGYVHAKGSIQFPLDKPLPKALITKITKLRVKQEEEQDKKWKTN